MSADDLLRWFRARLGGYFWLPCPICGRNFGGNERCGSLYLGRGFSKATCANHECMAKAAELSRANAASDPPIKLRMVPSGIGCAREITITGDPGNRGTQY